MVPMLGMLASLALPAEAQTIIPDGTTPTTFTGGATTCSNSCSITGGIQSAGNLFHSFARFGIDSGATVTFLDPGVQNIVTRVTGGDRSLIDGTLAVSGGNANLYILNPNGITFGDGASLQLGGSFVASTADAIAFEDGTFGLTDESATNSLLTVNIPTGLQVGANPGGITVNGTGNKLFLSPNRAINRPLLVPDLELGEQTLALVGGAVTLDGAVLSATGGRVEVGSVTEGIVAIAPAPQGLSLGYDNATSLGNITLANAALIDVSGSSAGEIQLQGQDISLSDGSAILAGTLGNGQGGKVQVNADKLLLSGAASFVPAFIPANAAPFVVLPSGIFASVEPNASGSGSEIDINVNELALSGGAQIAAATFSTGDAGALNIIADSITATGGLPAGPTGLFTTVSAGPDGGPGGSAAGNGGDLTITTQTLSLPNGAQVSAGSFGFGNAGNLTVNSQRIEVTGSFGEPGQGGPSSIRSASERPWAGNGGTISLTTDRLLVAEGGQIVTGTLSNGDAGELRVQADQVELRGGDSFGQSGLLSNTIDFRASGSQGKGGNIVVGARTLSISEEAIISASNLSSSANPNLTPGLGPVGNVMITVDELEMSDGSSITTASAGGEDGNIAIDANVISLRRNARITADASGAATGGNIAIATDFLIAPADEDSDITANADNNFGGNIEIQAQRLFGIQPRAEQTSQSDITASSQLGLNAAGRIEINDLDVDPSQGVAELSDGLADDSEQIAAACAEDAGPAANNVAGSFIQSGRGGLARAATQLLGTFEVWEDFRTVELTQSPSGSLPERADRTINGRGERPPLSEAQSWSSNSTGIVQLLAGQPPAQATTRCLKSISDLKSISSSGS